MEERARNGNGWQTGPGNTQRLGPGQTETEQEPGGVQAISESGTAIMNGQTKRPNKTSPRELPQPQTGWEPGPPLEK